MTRLKSLRQSQRFEHSGKNKRGRTMDFGVALIIANGLLAAFIYFILNRLWQG
jgi:hypothetical protein